MSTLSQPKQLNCSLHKNKTSPKQCCSLAGNCHNYSERRNNAIIPLQFQDLHYSYLHERAWADIQATLFTEWQCSFFILQKYGSFKRSFNIPQATLKSCVQPIKTIPGNLLLTVSQIIQFNSILCLFALFPQITYCTLFRQKKNINVSVITSRETLSMSAQQLEELRLSSWLP